MSDADIVAALHAIATDAGGFAVIRFVILDELPVLVADALAGDAGLTLDLLAPLANRVAAKALRCFCCARPIRRFPVVVLITADTPETRAGLGGVIGHCCEQEEPALYAAVIAALNAHIAGGAFQPLQFHAPGHA